MTYELAKKLKEAGYPGLMPFHDHEIKDDYERIVPTLSNLIEACLGTTIKLWILPDGRSGVQLEGRGLDDVIYYSTPVEAVAKLWLEINKKQ